MKSLGNLLAAAETESPARSLRGERRHALVCLPTFSLGKTLAKSRSMLCCWRHSGRIARNLSICSSRPASAWASCQLNQTFANFGFLALAVLASVSIFCGRAVAARDPEPLRIPLAPLGYQAPSADLLAAGGSLVTVNFADADHLLITFGVRRLMKRDEVTTADDDDRTVGAFLVELSTGKVLARAEWRLHDRGQYLWDLGHGRFLLRIRDRLSLLAPLQPPDPADAFHETPFLQVDRRIVAIMVSANDDLLTVETTDRSAAGQEATPQFSGTQAQNPAPVQINFYRLRYEAPAAGSQAKLDVIAAGVLRSRLAIALPLTTSGYLDVLEGARGQWLFNFAALAGKVSELAPFNTSCYPHVTFVSHSEFVAFGCRGNDHQNFAGFNLKGEEMWQQNFFDNFMAPVFSFAPQAGRFALERTIVANPPMPGSVPMGLDATAQEVRVYQTYSGKILYKTQCTPVERAGQNFALAPDGLRLAVVREAMVRHPATQYDAAQTVHEATVEIYPLPALNGKDEAAVQEAIGLSPKDTGERIDVALSKLTGHAPAEGAAGAVTGGASGAAGKGGAGVAASPMEVGQGAVDQGSPGNSVASPAGDPQPAALGDAESAAPRKPPTLYAPGEKPGSDASPPSKPQ